MERFKTLEKEPNPTIERTEYGWIDRAKRITYLAAFVVGFTGHEQVTAAEIPRNATLQEGITILKEAAKNEEIQTAAAYITLPSGDSYWISREGDSEWVDFYEAYEGEDSERVRAFLEEIKDEGKLGSGDTVTISQYHNHPMRSLIPEYSGPNFSIPPNGVGFLSNEEGDTAWYGEQIHGQVTAKFTEETNISVNWQNHVVDAVGTWTWSYDDELALQKNPLYHTRNKLETLLNREIAETHPDDAFNDKIRKLYKDVMEVIHEHEDAFNNWSMSSFEKDSQEFRDLVDSYKRMGIHISFTPHTD